MLNFVKRLSPAQKQAIFVFLDMALVPFALVASVAIRLDGVALNPSVENLLLVGSISCLSGALSVSLSIPTAKLNAYENGRFGRLALFSSIVTLGAYGAGAALTPDIPAGSFVIFGLIYFLAISALRLMMLQFVLGLYRRDASRCRVLIYGAGNTGLQIAQALKSHGEIVPVAFADDNTVLQGRPIIGLPVIRPSKIIEFAQTKGVDRVLIAMPSLSQPKRTQIARRLQEKGMEVQALPSFAQLIGEEQLVDKFAPVLPGDLMGRDLVDDPTLGEDLQFKGRTVLVSGAGGSIGSELCRQALGHLPAKLVLYELSELALYTIDNELRDLAKSRGVEIVPVLGSVTDARLVKKVLGDHVVDVVIHAAAYKHVPLVEANILVGLANNVLGTATLATAARDAGVERFILISSDKAVRPANVMGASKRLAELVVQDLAERGQGTTFSMVRFGNVLGSSGSVIPLFQEQIARGGPVTLTHPDVNRYFMTIQEAVRLVLRSSTFAKGGEVFVLDMGQPVPIARIARQMIELAGYSVRDESNPDGDIEILVTGLRPGEKMKEELLIGEGHLTTAHEKIFAAREARLSEIEVAAALRSLRAAVAAADDSAAMAVIARWVEGWPEVERRRATDHG